MLNPAIYLAAVLALVVVSTTVSLADNPLANVIPAVRQWQAGSGFFNTDQCNVILDARYESQLKAVVELFLDELQHVAPPLRNLTTAAQPVMGQLFVTLDPGPETIAPEGYILKINNTPTLRASTATGIYYGTRTLPQLLAQNPHELPHGTISDAPQYPIRSVLLDVGRKFIPYDELKDWVRTISYFKMNEIHLHLNDVSYPHYVGFRVEMKTIPALTSTDGYYTQVQLRELQDFARLRGVTITPEIDSPGHSRAFTCVRPELAHPQLGGNYLDITNEQTYRFMEKLFDEIVPLFDAPHFHIGTDEYRLRNIADPQEKEMLGEKFRQYINHFNDYLRKKGKTVRIWSGYEHMPGTTEPDKSIIIDMWETADAVNKSQAGYQFINSTHLWTYIVPGASYYGVKNTFLYDQWTPLRFSDDPEGILKPDAPGLLGGKLHIWNDLGPTGYTTNEIARLALPTVIVMAEKLWGTKGSADFNEFARKAAKLLPGGDGTVEMVPQSNATHSQDHPVLGFVPGTTFLRRKVASASHLVWQLQNKTMPFIANTSLQLNLPYPTENLEYPWSATFVITRYRDVTHKLENKPSGHEILLSSNLAAFYLDYSRELRDKEGTITATQRGVACVRAIRAPARTPFEHKGADIIVFDYQVPLNEKTTITFVGRQNLTQLYVNGKLVGTSNVQMLCPLKRLGDIYPNAFHGVLHDAAIYDTAFDQETIKQ